MPDKKLTPEEIEENLQLLQHLPAWFRHRGLTQAAVANKLGTSEATVSKWLRGRQRMNVPQFLRIAQLLDADPAELLAPPGDAAQAERIRRALRLARDLDAEKADHWLRQGEWLTKVRNS